MANLIEIVGFSGTALAFGILWVFFLLRSDRAHRPLSLISAPLLTVLWASTNATAAVLDFPLPLTAPFQVAHTFAWILVLHQLMERPMSHRQVERVVLGVIALVAAGSGFANSLFAEPSRAFTMVFGGGMCLLVIAGLLAIEHLFRNSEPTRFWALKHLMLGCAVLMAFDLVLYAEVFLFGELDQTYRFAQGFVDMIAAPLIAVSLMRHQSWRVDLHVSREVVYHSTVLIVSGLYLLGMAAAGYYVQQFGGDWGKISVIVIAVVTIVTLTLGLSSESIRARLRVWISQHFFSHKYDYRKEWLRFTGTLSHESETLSFHQRLLHAIGDLVDSTGGAIWLHMPEDQSFALQTHVNMGDKLRAIPESHPLVTYLSRSGEIIDLEQLRRNQGHQEAPDLPEWLAKDIRAWLIIPLVHRDVLIGFVALARSRAPRPLDWEDHNLLRVAGQQVASYAAEERSLRTLEDAKKLEDFHRRFAFVVHDIKNAISQLSMLLRNAEKHGSNPEFQSDMLHTIENTVARMTSLMERLQAGRAAEKVEARQAELEKIVRNVFSNWQHKIDDLDLAVTALKIPKSVEEETLQTVLDHLLANASEAAGQSGKVELGLIDTQDGPRLYVKDNGPGMSDEFIRENLFRPLISSKSGGFGIGAFQVQQLVREMGGHLEVQSKPGEGTVMSIYFFRHDAESDTANSAQAGD